jgi:hypothetical protein
METREHLGLKELASAWLLSMGCRAVAHEVPCPVARFRVDAAGWSEHDWRDGIDSAAHGSVFAAERSGAAVRAPKTVVVECKASRADFLRDDLRVDDLLAERDRLLARKAEIERELIPVHEPHLRAAGDALFEQEASWDFGRSRLLPYRRVLRQLAKVEERLHGQTKFNLIARWRLADELWILAATDVVRRREVPAGWGLAECNPALLRRGIGHALRMGTLPLRVVVPAPRHASPDHRRARLLRNIAVALTKAQFGRVTEPGGVDAPSDADAVSDVPPPSDAATGAPTIGKSRSGEHPSSEPSNAVE